MIRALALLACLIPGAALAQLAIQPPPTWMQCIT